jgi:NAD(P)-dependent dehydrogenase (short-subunit alcohol dehydrogenase family)
VAGFALITGGGSGIGRQSALTLAGAGWSVAVAGRRTELLEATTRDAMAVPTDLREQTAIDELFAAVEGRFGRLDLLFNNAGVNVARRPIDEINADGWRTVVDTNVTAAFLCTQHAFRIMKAQDPRGGRIINNGSVSAQVPRPHSAPYATTKHALTGLTKATSLDGRGLDIACGQIDIGNAHTDMTRPASARGPSLQPDGSMRQEPTMHVQHAADAVLFMAQLPLDVNVPFVTVMANNMPYIGRG